MTLINMNGLQRQEAFLDRLDSTPIFCPHCLKAHTVKEIAGEDYNKGNTDSGVCTETGKPLTRAFALFGGEMYFNPVTNTKR